MFEFVNDIGNYAERRIGRDDFEWGFVSTVQVSYGIQPFETAISHREYTPHGEMTFVEAYDSREEAAAGHAKWLAVMTAGILPDRLVDCCNVGVAQLVGYLDETALVYERKIAIVGAGPLSDGG